MASSSRKQAISDLLTLVRDRSADGSMAIERALGTNTAVRKATQKLLSEADQHLLSSNDERALSRAFEQLLSAAVSIDVGPPFDSRPWTDTFRSMRDMLAARVLLAYGYRHPAQHVIVRLLARARKAQITSIEIMCLFQLRMFLSLQGKLRDVQHVSAQISSLVHLEALELEAEGWEDVATALVANKRISHPASIRQIENMGRKAETLRKNYDRWVFHATAFRLRGRAMQLRNDWHGALAVCDEAVEYYRSHPEFSSPSRLGEFVLRAMVCLTKLNDLDGARRRAEAVRPLLAQNTAMWIIVLEYLFNLAMRATRLPLAAEICAEARRFHTRTYTVARRERWKFREVAVSTLAQVFPSDVAEIERHLGSTRYYLNNVERRIPSVGADKQGMNAQLLYAKVLYYLNAKRYSDIVELRESIGLYVKRHLLGAASQRTATFFRMLMRISTNEFDADACERACAHFDDRLRFAIPAGNDDAELIPYDVLWRAVLDVLRRNATDTRRRR
ncbi:MAG: hypothetical protein JSS89_04195 [Bacteroidetes bacterium]|nr:hypothetical protein [Bacteroidota bacterium]